MAYRNNEWYPECIFIKSKRVLCGFILVTLLSSTAQSNSNCTLVAVGPRNAVDFVGHVAYFGNGGKLEIIGFSDPENPVKSGVMLRLAVQGSTVFVADERWPADNRCFHAICISRGRFY